MQAAVSIREAIERTDEYEGWLYLPSNEPWRLDTAGFFYSPDLSLSPDEEKGQRDLLSANGFASAVSKEDIEDVIANTDDQLEDASTEGYFTALLFFYENDAFKDWS